MLVDLSLFSIRLFHSLFKISGIVSALVIPSTADYGFEGASYAPLVGSMAQAWPKLNFVNLNAKNASWWHIFH